MSYNYLPLDRKPINFQQVKNLLDFDQLLSVTFDAHERILHCRDYLDNKKGFDDEFDGSVNFGDSDHLKNQAYGQGKETSPDIIKLMLMLKIKSLSSGHSGVHIETVKRLLEMYNNGVLPVIYNEDNDVTALSRLGLFLTGSGQVHHKGEKRNTADVLKELKWQPLILQKGESLALVNGNQFTAACGLYSLKKAEQLISMANAIAALSIYASGCSTEFLHKNIYSVKPHNWQVKCAALLRSYLKNGNINHNREKDNSSSFNHTPAVHGAVMDAFEYVSGIFVTEANSVTESPVIFPDDDLILSNANNVQQLVLALDFLSIVIISLGNSSQKRTAQLNEEVTSQAVALMNDTRQLCSPASIEISSATGSLQVINNVEKVLAIELISAVQALQKQDQKSPPALEKLVNAFSQKCSIEKNNFDENLTKAVSFIATYEL